MAITLLALSGCNGESSIIDPAGPAAQTIAALWWVMLAGSALIFLLVMVLVGLAFRPKPEAPGEKRQIRIWVLAFGIAFPMVVLGALLAYALVIGERLLPRNDADVVRVGAEGRRWSWTFSYENASGQTTTDVLHIPAGRPVDIAITTQDVIHSFWVPRLAGKLDAIPGRINTLRIEADEPGTYQGFSAEFSGSGYGWFTFEVTAHDAAGWAAFAEDREE